ncbi:MAG: sn-glycerol-3-phosphate ABC transporter ATP-binding protein UgpC [Paracoccaceae bacterium]|nr:sn-glycerol-3-phosphate ABC transporter ATP-binding protein UgpC [Paracoccaceae bacterium]
MTEIVLENVYKSYGSVEVIHGVSLRVESGEFVVFVGPSGCGKSTLLRIIAGLEDVTRGDVRIDGESVRHVSASERGLAMVFQSYALYPHMTVYKNMAFGLENSKLPKTEIDRLVSEAAEMLQITPYLQRRPKALSGGQRQRVAIGRAIVRDPKAFLFDEPLSNLDAELRVAMRKELSALYQKIGGTMIYVTHDQTEAMTLADRIVVLQDGVVEQAGRPLDLYNSPRNVFVAGFIGSPKMNLMDARSVEGAFVAGSDRIEVPPVDGVVPGQEVTLGIRPEHLEVADPETADFEARVDFSEQLGGETYFYCTVEGIPQLTVHRIGQHPVRNGDHLHLRFDRRQLHLFDAAGQVIANGLPE